MKGHIILSIIGILAGSAVMLVSIFRSASLMQALPLVPSKSRGRLKGFLYIHRALMGFFLAGYLAVAAAFYSDTMQVGQIFVSLIFFLGAVFVLVGILIQASLLSHIESTLEELIPICSVCKKIRQPSSDPRDPSSWKPIEIYLSGRTKANFSHGLCPECMEKTMDEIE